MVTISEWDRILFNCWCCWISCVSKFRNTWVKEDIPKFSIITVHYSHEWRFLKTSALETEIDRSPCNSMELLPTIFTLKNIHNCLIVIKQWGVLDCFYQHKSTGQLLASRCSVCCCDGLPLKSLIMEVERLAIKCNSPTLKTGNL